MELQKPGAGLPDFERLFIKHFLVPTIRGVFTWNIALFMFKRESRLISKLVSKVKKEDLQKKTIIDRVFAIEDHSRQFSINMVVEHLCIAGSGIMGVIERLSKEEKIDQEITIEGVKPFANKENIIEEFEAFVQKYENFINSLDKRVSTQRKRHPWFVEFNNFEWSVFMYMHTFIHRRQIEAIIAKLKEENV